MSNRCITSLYNVSLHQSTLKGAAFQCVCKSVLIYVTIWDLHLM